MFKGYKAYVDEDKCRKCGFCDSNFRCYSNPRCSGCLACYFACPYEARRIVEKELSEEVKIFINEVELQVPKEITVAKALELIGFKFEEPGSKGVSLACKIGGCWACMVLINGEPERSCITSVEEGMKIETNVNSIVPRRIVHGPQPHKVGGKATPWIEVNGLRYIEAAIWVAGCNLRCPQCQNYHITYDNTSLALTSEEAAKELTWCSRVYGTKGLAISGGEPTLNRAWLIEFFKHLKKLNQDKSIRLHLDSNGTLLTPDYIDELVEVGCNNIGVEPKSLRLDTYIEITGVRDRELATRYLETSWNALKYLVEKYEDKVYLGVGIAYNGAWMSLEEVVEIGDRICSIDPSVQVTVLDYFPAFRRKNIRRPFYEEMFSVKNLLESRGLNNVVVQTSMGHITPSKSKDRSHKDY
ncbi:MAG: radical SAM protein [archaeon]|nr:radical SAM protein [archaeon]MCP8318150.1 radical SAM protein [archaeon]